MSYTGECRICGSVIGLGVDTVKDELVECRDCGSELVVLSLRPFLLEEAPQAEEDWGQ